MASSNHSCDTKTKYALKQPNIAKKRFRNVSIITELNSQKDQLNKLGSLRFETETGQKLTDFYSVGELGGGHYTAPHIPAESGGLRRTLVMG